APALLGAPTAYALAPGALAALILVMFVASMGLCASLNVAIERIAYRPLRGAPKLAPLISAIGVSFILVNIGLHWKGASQVDFPNVLPDVNIFSDILRVNTAFHASTKDLIIILLVLPLAAG